MKPERETVEVWITKYALSTGVFKITAEVCDGYDGRMIRGVGTSDGTYYHSSAWHRTEDEAMTRVAKMIQIKRRSIEKQIKNLDKLQAMVDSGKLSIKGEL